MNTPLVAATGSEMQKRGPPRFSFPQRRSCLRGFEHTCGEHASQSVERFRVEHRILGVVHPKAERPKSLQGER